MMFLGLQARKPRALLAALILSPLVGGPTQAQEAPVGIYFQERSTEIRPDWKFFDQHLIVRANSQGFSPTVTTRDLPIFASGVELEDESRLELYGAKVHNGLALHDASVASLTSREIVDYVTVQDASRLESIGAAVSKPWQVGSLIAMDDATLVLDDGQVSLLRLEDRSTAEIRDTRIGTLEFPQSRDLALEGGSLKDFSTVAGTNLTLNGVELGAGTLKFSTESRIGGSAWTSGLDSPTVSFSGDFDYDLEVFDRPPQEQDREPARIDLAMSSPGWLRLHSAVKGVITLPFGGVLTSETGPIGSVNSGSLDYEFAKNLPQVLLKLPHAKVAMSKGGLRGVLGDGSEVNFRLNPGQQILVSTSETAFEEFRPLVFYNAENGHYYEAGIGRLSWPDARDLAERATYGGAPGHLASITSESEQRFINETFEGLGGIFGAWIGGSDAEVEGEWRWVGGPEDGDLFWLGNEGGEAIGYANWTSDIEPNNWFGGENYISWNWHGDLRWNDYNGPQDAYLIEYEPVPGDANGDGVADLADFAAMREHFGDYADRAHGDLNADLFVDLADFQLLKASFGAAPAPEPSAGLIALLGAGLASLLSLRTRRTT